jgi:hypothetical protein
VRLGIATASGQPIPKNANEQEAHSMIRPVFFAALSRSVFSSLGIALLAFAIFPVTAQGQEIKVTLLGTGCPLPL